MSDLLQRLAGLSEDRRALLGRRLKQRSRETGGERIEPRPPDTADLPPSFGQQRLWFLDQLEPGSAAYNVPAVARLEGALDVAALERSLGEIVRRHESLRTSFAVRAGEPFQVIAQPGRFQLPLVDLTAQPAPGRRALAETLAGAEIRRPFDLARGPLFRALIVRLEPQAHLLVATVHHIVADGWSIGVLFDELAALYGALAAAVLPPLAELPIQYADFALWQRRRLRGGTLEAQLAFWRQALAGAPPLLELPHDRPRPPRQTSRGTFARSLLQSPITERLRELAQRHDATLFMIFLAGFAALLGGATGQRRIAIGTPVAGRGRVETESLIGFFANTLVIVTDLVVPCLGELLREVRERVLGALSHQDLPFEKLVEELRPERSLSHTPLCQAALSFQNAPYRGLRLPGLAIERLPMETGTAIFDLLLSVETANAGLQLLLQYNTDLFDGTTAVRLLEHLRLLLAAAADEPDRRVDELPRLAAAERHQIVCEWNDTSADLPAQPVHRLIAQQAERSPCAIALRSGGATTTYAELDRRANRLARRLMRLGAGPDAFVGLFVERCPEMLVAMLAILKAGAAYVPLDPRYPADRTAFTIQNAHVAVIVTQRSLAPRLRAHGARLMLLDEPDDAGGCPDVAVQGAVDLENAAYVVYTSGSTGRPKGVVIRHRALTNLLVSCARLLAAKDLSGVLAATSICFDMSVFEIFLPWTLGGAVILAADALHLDGLPELQHLTLLNTVPSVASELARPGALPASLRVIVLGGEPLRRPLVTRLLAARPALRVFNAYAPSETTTYSTWHEAGVAAGGGREPTLGRPIGNTTVHVLGRDLRPVPCGVYGEIAIGGEGLARGYLDRPHDTAERFVPDPFGTAAGSRLYLTGDFARRLPDGEIELLGRRDDQVKIRGFRIELGEIEAALGRCAGIAEAVVVAREDAPGDHRLIAYVMPGASGPAVPATAALKAELRRRLPEHMVPGAVVVLPTLPRLPNGKVDRRSLPPPEARDHSARPAAAAPPSPTEELLAAIWAVLLGVASPGPDANFFDLGGHSLLAMRMVSRLREVFGVELPVARVLELPRLAELARAVDGAAVANVSSAGPELTARPEDAEAPLSFAQQQLWSLLQVHPRSRRAYHLPLVLSLAGALDREALESALGVIVRRHGALRTTFRLGPRGPVQVVARAAAVPLPLVDLSELPEAERTATARRLAETEARRPFEQARGPLVRAKLLRLRQQEHHLLLTLDHLIADGWSLSLLWAELAALYPHRSCGSPDAAAPALPDLPLQYADFARWQRERLQGELLDRELAYWRQQLAGPPPHLELPADRPRPAAPSFEGAAVRVTVARSGALRSLGREHSATLFMILAAGFAALLLRLTGQSDLAVGAPVAGRTRGELEGIIGLFVNLLVLRLDLSADPTFLELLERTRSVCLAAYAHQELPFERLVHHLNPERAAGRGSLVAAVLTLHAEGAAAPRLPGLDVTLIEGAATTAKFDLALGLADTGGQLAGWLEYGLDLFDPATVARWSGHLARLLEGAAAAPATRLSSLPVLDEAESWCVLGEWGHAAAQTSRQASSAEMFAAEAARRPDALAVSDAATAVSYGELAARAGELAGRLSALGVGAEVPVAVCLERSSELVIAAVATALAGGVYLPLDPSHPDERLRFMLHDAAPGVILSRATFARRFRTAGVPILCLDDGGAATPPRAAVRDVHPRGDLRHLAYAIYTSGSTGVPKAVALAEMGLASLLDWHRVYHQSGPEARWTLLAAPGFDASIWEIWGALAAGASLHVPPRELLASPAGLPAWMAEHGITHSFLTTPLAEALLAGELPPDLGLRVLLTGGARLSRAPSRPLPFRFVNHYGPTEATVVATCSEVRPGSRGAPPIGRPVAAVRVAVLDAQMGLAPIGVTGEIHLGGKRVARAYLGRPDLTADRFVPNPFGAIDEPGSRLYRTGDLGRWRADGELEFLGRLDDQVKIRGYRVEPGEIEVSLKRHPAVREAAVVARSGRHGSARLIAYVAAGEPNRQRATELRDALLATLPEYMVPSEIVVLAAMPLDANGKIDRRALPEPASAGAEERGEKVAPRNPVEACLAAIWRDVLGIAEVGVHDDFFELGGDSIQSIQIVARANGAGLQITPKQLFERPSIAELAETARSAACATGLIELGETAGPLPLTPIQAWFFERELPRPAHFNQSLLLALDGPVEIWSTDLIERVLAVLFAHHDALRLRFERGASGWRQEVDGRASAPRVLRCDLAALPGRWQAPALERAAAHLQAGLDLSRPPLARAAVFDLGASGRRLLLAVHHLVIDAVSWRILLADLETAVRHLLHGEPPLLPAKTTSFGRWARRLVGYAQSGAFEAELDWWSTAGRHGAAPLPRRDTPVPDTVGSSGTVAAVLDRRTTRALLRELPRTSRVHMEEALVAAVAVAFSEWTGASSLVLALEGHGRESLFPDIDLTRTVGWFTTLFPVQVTLPASSDPLATLDAVKAQLRAVPGRGIGYGLLRHSAGAGAARRLRHLPQPEVSLNYLGQFDSVLADRSLFRPAREAIGPDIDPAAPRAHLFEVSALVLEGRLRVTWTYGERAHSHAEATALCGSFMAALRRFADHCPAAAARRLTPADVPLARLAQDQLDRLPYAACDVEDVYPLAPGQQGMLFHSVLTPDSPVYFLQLRCSLEGTLDPGAFAASWQHVVARHPALRTAFHWRELEIAHQVVMAEVGVPIVVQDWRGLATAEWRRRLDSYLKADRGRGFDLSRAPLMRLALLRTADDTHQLLWSYHHLLADGWCVSRLLQEVFALHDTLRAGIAPRLSPSAPYRDYIAWLEQQSAARAELFWRQRLAGFIGPTPLRGDRDPEGVATEAEGHGEQEVRLAASASDALRALARAHRLTLATLVQGAWALLLGHDSGSRDVVFGATVAGRPSALPGVETMVGLFINTLPVRARIDPAQPLVEFLSAVQEWQTALREFEWTPLSVVQRCSAAGHDRRLFRSILVFENYPVDNSLADGAGGLRVAEVEFFDRNNYPMSLGVVPGRELALRIKHDAFCFSADTIGRLLARLTALLEVFTARPGADLAELLATLTELDRRHFAQRSERLRGTLRRLGETPRRGLERRV